MKLKEKLPWILFIIVLETQCLSILNAQTEALDSLNRALNLTMDEDQRVRNLNLIANELRIDDPLRSMEYADKALELALKSENLQEIAFSHVTRGMLYAGTDDYTLSLNSFLDALTIYLRLGSEEDIARTYYWTGSLYKTLGNYEKAIEHCLAGLKIYEDSDNKQGIALIYRVMGSIYKYKEDYEKSLYYYFNGLKINEDLGNLSGIANSYNNIGVVYILMNEEEKALGFYHKSMAINLAENRISEAGINYGNIGTVFLQTGNLDSAKYYLDKKYRIAVDLKDKRGIANSLEDYGNFFLKTKDYPLAISYFDQALKQSRELGIMENTKAILKSLSDLFIERGDYEKAWGYFNSYIGVRDSLLNREALQKMEQMEMEYNFEKERNEHKLREQKNKLLITIGYAALFFALLSIGIIYMILNIKLKHKNLKAKTLEIEKQKLMNEVSFKDKELFSKAVHLAEKNELISDITRRLNTVMADTHANSSTIKDIIKELKFNSNTKMWDEFECTFLKVHPEFFNSLGKHFPALTANERRLCAFLKLNLSTKDISTITHQSLHSLTVARTRLRKKLGIANTGESLASFLNKF